MRRRVISAVATALALGGIVLVRGPGDAVATSKDHCAPYQPALPGPSSFVAAVDNKYFPLPVGRVLIYRGVEEGRREIDRVRVTGRTKAIEGITATVVRDEVLAGGKVLERTFDWYAQDDTGNVWYLGENTKEFLPNGKTDTSGSWEAGADGAKPGILMEADPRVPDAYRQECLSGEAEDLAWVVGRGGRLKVPDGVFRHVLKTLEFSPLEAGVVDRKIYGPGVGIAFERGLSGGQEVFRLERVRG